MSTRRPLDPLGTVTAELADVVRQRRFGWPAYRTPPPPPTAAILCGSIWKCSPTARSFAQRQCGSPTPSSWRGRPHSRPHKPQSRIPPDRGIELVFKTGTPPRAADQANQAAVRRASRVAAPHAADWPASSTRRLDSALEGGSRCVGGLRAEAGCRDKAHLPRPLVPCGRGPYWQRDHGAGGPAASLVELLRVPATHQRPP